jgi:hypothetical protein
MSHKNMYEYKQHDHRGYERNHHGGDLNKIIINFLIRKLKNNKKLLVLLILAVVIVITVAIFLLISLFPVIYKIMAYIKTNGVNGVVDFINNFLEKLWPGK